MFLVWIVFTAAAKVITSRGKCILSVFSPVILKPLISSLLWSLHHENISFRSKVISINVLKICPGFTCPGYRSSRL
jgi:hypothetical protein